MPPASSISKLGPVSIDRTKASVAQPAAETGQGDNRTQVYTYLTNSQPDGQTPVLYNGDRMWAKITLTLQTAGPVAVGQSSDLFPVLGGKGVLLVVNEPFEVTIAKGNRLYIAANNINRVAVRVEPLPWLEQITGVAMKIASK